MTETITRTEPAAEVIDANGRCRHCMPVHSDLVGLFGHDALGHRVVSRLLEHGVLTRRHLASLTSLDLLLIRGFGHGAVERIRTFIPEPATAPLPSAPATLPPPREQLRDPDELYGATNADLRDLALLARLPAEVEVTPATLADSAIVAALWTLVAISRTDPRIWRHVHLGASGISFNRLMDEKGFTRTERTLLRIARSLARRGPYAAVQVDLPALLQQLDTDQWVCVLNALNVCRAHLRGEF